MNLHREILKIAEKQYIPTRPDAAANLVIQSKNNKQFQENNTHKSQKEKDSQEKSERTFGISLKNKHNTYLMIIKAKTGINRDILIQALIEEIMNNKDLEEKIIINASNLQNAKKAKKTQKERNDGWKP